MTADVRLFRRHSAHVENPEEIRMGSPRYGRLILDRKPTEFDDIESESLLWSEDRRLLAAQELLAASTRPTTRVVVIDADSRKQIAASAPEKALCDPLRFEEGAVTYRVWTEHGERELRLPLG
jgi:hypothetical protein